MNNSSAGRPGVSGRHCSASPQGSTEPGNTFACARRTGGRWRATAAFAGLAGCLLAFAPVAMGGPDVPGQSPAGTVAPPAQAASPAKAAPPAAPAAPAVAVAAEVEAPRPLTQTHVGVYVNQLPTVSLKDNRFEVDFYIWFRWVGDAVKPHETFELSNGRILLKKLIETKIIKGQNYAILRVTAQVTKFWDVAEFPMDDHELELQIEDSVSEEQFQVYVPDTVNSTVAPEVQVPGWNIAAHRTFLAVKTYATNYGDLSLPKDAQSKYSRFVMAIALKRDGLGAFFKLFFGLWVAVCIAMLSFLLLPSDPGPRLGFAVGAIFASVGASYAITNSLPFTTVFTLAEQLNVLTVAAVFLALLGNVYSVRACKLSGDLARSLRFDRVWACVVLGFYGAGNALVLSL